MCEKFIWSHENEELLFQKKPDTSKTNSASSLEAAVYIHPVSSTLEVINHIIAV